MDMMTHDIFCPHCGQPLPAGSKFCFSCGSSLASGPMDTARSSSSVVGGGNYGVPTSGVSLSAPKCPHCGEPLSTGMTACPYCKSPVYLTTFKSVADIPLPELRKRVSTYDEMLSSGDDAAAITSKAMCYLKLGLTSKAYTTFEKAVEKDFDNPEVYFYTALCSLDGQEAFACSREVIEEAEEMVQAAIKLENRGIFYYFWAYLKYDFYARRRIGTSPDYGELLSLAANNGLTYGDMDSMYAILGVERPSEL